VDQVKGYSHTRIYSRGELDNSSQPNQTGAKGSTPEKHFSANEKELPTLSQGVADDDDDDDDDDDNE
jgi:hypothetical protein